MKTIRTYLSGCTWCNATGIKYPMENYSGTGMTNVCPVCHGTGTIPVVETFEGELEDQLKEEHPNLKELLKRLDDSLAKETPESLNKFLSNGQPKKIMMTSEEYYKIKSVKNC